MIVFMEVVLSVMMFLACSIVYKGHVRVGLGDSFSKGPVRASPNKRLILPGARYPTKNVAIDRHMTDGREREVSGYERLAVRRQLPQKTDAHAGRFLGV